MTIKIEPQPSKAHSTVGCPAKATRNYRPAGNELPQREAKAAVVGTRRPPNPAWGWKEGFQGKVTTLVNSKNEIGFAKKRSVRNATKVEQAGADPEAHSGRSSAGLCTDGDKKKKRWCPGVRTCVVCVHVFLCGAGENEAAGDAAGQRDRRKGGPGL